MFKKIKSFFKRVSGGGGSGPFGIAPFVLAIFMGIATIGSASAQIQPKAQLAIPVAPCFEANQVLAYAKMMYHQVPVIVAIKKIEVADQMGGKKIVNLKVFVMGDKDGQAGGIFISHPRLEGLMCPILTWEDNVIVDEPDFPADGVEKGSTGRKALLDSGAVPDHSTNTSF